MKQHRQIERTTPRAWAVGECECGAKSAHPLPSYAGRIRWFRAHRLDVRMDAVLGDRKAS